MIISLETVKWALLDYLHLNSIDILRVSFPYKLLGSLILTSELLIPRYSSGYNTNILVLRLF